ncbi:NAD(P)H-binding protein [Nocardia sp. NPDC051911]|uniref:NAD(P)H-binding protein n=1 Tax=Nocardia sp. NPDC051911 TaxID=3154648 RepID=UPI003425E8A8
MRITVFGANGPTGRLLTGQALDAGHEVAAVTRRPDSFPLRHARLEVVGAATGVRDRRPRRRPLRSRPPRGRGGRRRLAL